MLFDLYYTATVRRKPRGYFDGKRGIIADTPKTGTSIRKIPLPKDERIRRFIVKSTSLIQIDVFQNVKKEKPRIKINENAQLSFNKLF